jgi:2-hydroxychromene-2-carboxylate isomerase
VVKVKDQVGLDRERMRVQEHARELQAHARTKADEAMEQNNWEVR